MMQRQQMGQQVLLKKEGRHRHDCKDWRRPGKDGKFCMKDKKLDLLDKMLIPEIAFGKILDFKEKSLSLMLTVWVLIYSFCNLVSKYSVFSFARGSSELYSYKRWEYTALQCQTMIVPLMSCWIRALVSTPNNGTFGCQLVNMAKCCTLTYPLMMDLSYRVVLCIFSKRVSTPIIFVKKYELS